MKKEDYYTTKYKFIPDKKTTSTWVLMYLFAVFCDPKTNFSHYSKLQAMAYKTVYPFFQLESVLLTKSNGFVRSETTRYSNVIAALLYVRTGLMRGHRNTWNNGYRSKRMTSTETTVDVASDVKAFNVRVANKNYNFRVLFVVVEVEYLWNGWIKMDRVNANLVLCNWLTLNSSLDLPVVLV